MTFINQTNPVGQPRFHWSGAPDDALAQADESEDRAGDKPADTAPQDACPPAPGVNVYRFGDQNIAFYYWELSRYIGELPAGATLIHFDLNPGLNSRGYTEFPAPPPLPSAQAANLKDFAFTYGNYTAANSTVASFIAPAIYDGTIKEIWWVLPEYAGPGTKGYQYFWLEENYYGDVLYETPADFVFYVGQYLDSQSQEEMIYFSENPPPERPAVTNLRAVIIRERYLKELPVFDSCHPLILNIGATWFASTGWNTPYEVASFPAPEQAEAMVDQFFMILREKNIHPLAVTFARNPDSCPTDLADNIERRILTDIGQILPEPEFLDGAPSYSVNTVRFAQCLRDFISDNYQNCRRRNPAEFNQEEVKVKLAYLDESKLNRISSLSLDAQERASLVNGIFNRPLPPKHCEKTLKFLNKRGDYSFFIGRARDYGLLELVEILSLLESLQNNPPEGGQELEGCYLKALEYLDPICGFLKD